MKPALSIVLFTVLSGAGLGLAAVLAAFPSDMPRPAFLPTAACAIVLTAAGLLSSVWHLANPKNAWRAVMRVRTSWLSREAVLATIFFPLMAWWIWLQYNDQLSFEWQLAVIICALLTVKCTAMIYQSLKPIAAWHHFLTSINYLCFSLVSGGLLFAIFAAASGGLPIRAAVIVILLVPLVGMGKIWHYQRIGRAQDIQVGRATGFTQAKARLLDAGHTGPTFLTREFIFEVPAAHLRLLRWISLPLVTVSPLIGAWLTIEDKPALAVVCLMVMFIGLLIERWVFFAEARHIVRLYHGKELV